MVDEGRRDELSHGCNTVSWFVIQYSNVGVHDRTGQ